MSSLTSVLGALRAGESEAVAQLIPLGYNDLRRLAAPRLAPAVPGNTLDPTALVHEAYRRLVGDRVEVRRDYRGPFVAVGGPGRSQSAATQVIVPRIARHPRPSHWENQP
jgi:hypothetical protein